jgi:hypothetical protein
VGDISYSNHNREGIVQVAAACILDAVLPEDNCVSSVPQYKPIFAKVIVSPT